MHDEKTDNWSQYLTYVGADLSLLESRILSEEPSDLVLYLKFEELVLIHLRTVGYFIIFIILTNVLGIIRILVDSCLLVY